jgi:Domain of unknown function (DUF6794)
MKSLIKSIPTCWVLAILVMGIGIVSHSIFVMVTRDGTRKEQEVYIPKDLDDCFVELKKILKPEDVQEMKEGTELDMIIYYHHGFGTWIRNNWGLWRGSRLSEWFNQRGIYHPDDMSSIIFNSFWRHLNGKPIGLDKQIKLYQAYWNLFQKFWEGLTPQSPEQYQPGQM